MTDQRTKPVIISSQEQLNTYWPQVEPLLQSAPISNEFSPAAIAKAVVNNDMHMFLFVTETSEVELVLVLAPVPSELFPVYTIVTAAGKDLRKHAKQYWEAIKGWCYMNGARAIDAYVPERLEAFMEELGLKKETTHVRLCL